jgi:hypothetical protein
MAGEGLVYAFAFILIWFVLFVLIPIVAGVFLLLRFRRHKKREASGAEPKKKYRGKILLGTAIALIGFGVFVISAQTIITQMEIQRSLEGINREPPIPNQTGQQANGKVEQIDFNLYANGSECCFIGLRLHPDEEHDGTVSVEFIRHAPGCSATTYHNCPEKDKILHVIDFQTGENHSEFFDPLLNEYRFPLSKADFQILNQTRQYDLVLVYIPDENDTVYTQRLWNQTLDFSEHF